MNIKEDQGKIIKIKTKCNKQKREKKYVQVFTVHKVMAINSNFGKKKKLITFA